MKRLLLLGLLLSLEACAKGAPPPVIRKDEDKLWRPCQDTEVQNGSAVGKTCSKTCIQHKSGKCIKWNVRTRNFCEKPDFEFFRNGTFILIDEDNL